MAGNNQKTLEDLNLTKDELDRFSKAFKDEEFRKLFREYAEEINDPENRKKYEEEICKMEAERNMDVKFVHPKPGYVLKTVVDGKTKAFVNIATNELVDKPSHKRTTDENGKAGLVWSIPHFFAPPRDDMDKEKKQCRVFDVIFHPDTFRMAESNARFKKIVEDTAWDGIERQFAVSFDRKNVRRPKMKYKGQPVATVIRSRKEETDGVEKKGDEETSPLDKFPYPYDSSKTTVELSEEATRKAEERQKKTAKEENRKQKEEKEEEKEEDSKYTEPKYQLKYSQDVRMEDFGSMGQPTDDLGAKSRRPDRVVVDIDLPLIKSAGSLDLDIGERSLTLLSEKPAAYKLSLRFAYPVVEEGGQAKFDKKTRTLKVTLPVIPEKAPPLQPPAPSVVQEEEDVEVKEEGEDEEQREEEQQEDLAPVSAAGDADPLTITALGALPHAAPGARLPEASWREDAAGVALLCRTHGAQRNSVRLSRDPSGCYLLAFSSLGRGGWPQDLALFFRPLPPDAFKDRLQRLDAQPENLVLRFERADGRRLQALETSADGATWMPAVCSHAAPGPSRAELATLLGRLAAADEVGPARSLEVTELSQQRLTVALEEVAEEECAVVNFEPGPDPTAAAAAAAAKEDEEERRAASIEVVFKEPPQRLHSILKKQTSPTSSESIGDAHDAALWCHCARHSSADDIHGLHKSVSFSGRPEVASFCGNQPVCSLHATLKNRRRNVRRREQRRRVASFNRGSSSSEDNEVLSACAAAMRGAGKGRGQEQRQRHYSDSFLVTDFVDANDFVLQEEGAKTTAPDTSAKKSKKKRKHKEAPAKEEETKPIETHVKETKDEEEAKEKETNAPPSAPSSGISWKDEPHRSSEHRTHCPIDFANADVFELDDD